MDGTRPSGGRSRLLAGALIVALLVIVGATLGSAFLPRSSSEAPPASASSARAGAITSPATTPVSTDPIAAPSPGESIALTPQPTLPPQPTNSADASASPSLPTTPGPTEPPSATADPTAGAEATGTPLASPTEAPRSGWIELADFPIYRGSTSVESITAGRQGFVAVGSGGRTIHGRVWTSADGMRWTAHADDQFDGYFLRQVVRMGGDLYAFGRNEAGTRVWRSDDGRNWTLLDESPELRAAGLNDVVEIGGTLVAVGWSEDPEYRGGVWRSADGSTWQRVSLPDGVEELWAVAAGGGTLVGISGYPHLGGPMFVRSTDLGDSWQTASTDMGFDDGGGLAAVAANDRRFVAVGYRETETGHEPIAFTSSDGSGWASVRLGDVADQLLEQVTVLPGGRFLALGRQGVDVARARVSTDGLDWTEVVSLYEGQTPPRSGEGGDGVIYHRSLAANSAGVVVAQDWGNGVRVWFGPPELFD